MTILQLSELWQVKMYNDNLTAVSVMASKNIFIASNFWTDYIWSLNFASMFSGAVTLGINANGEALKHWFETLKTSDRRVTRWHTLSPTMPSPQDMDDMNTIIKWFFGHYVWNWIIFVRYFGEYCVQVFVIIIFSWGNLQMEMYFEIYNI